MPPKKKQKKNKAKKGKKSPTGAAGGCAQPVPFPLGVPARDHAAQSVGGASNTDLPPVVDVSGLVARYGLLPVPPAVLANNKEIAALVNNNQAWARYAKQRDALPPTPLKQQSTKSRRRRAAPSSLFMLSPNSMSDTAMDKDETKGDEEEEDDEEEDDEEAAGSVQDRVSQSILKRCEGILRLGQAEPTLAKALLAGVRVQVSADSYWPQEDEDFNVRTRFYSPFAIPIALELEFTYHHRAQMYCVELFHDVTYRVLDCTVPHSPAVLAGRDDAQADNADLDPRLRWHTLFAVQHAVPPSRVLASWLSEAAPNLLHSYVEDHNVKGLNANTARLFARTLLGRVHEASVPLFTFMTFVVAGCGVHEDGVRLGYVQRIDAADVIADDLLPQAIKAAKEEDSAEPPTSFWRSWLQHHVRLATNSADTLDLYYNHEARVKELKTYWGKELLELLEAEKSKSADMEDDYDLIDDYDDDSEFTRNKWPSAEEVWDALAEGQTGWIPEHCLNGMRARPTSQSKSTNKSKPATKSGTSSGGSAGPKGGGAKGARGGGGGPVDLEDTSWADGIDLSAKALSELMDILRRTKQ